MKCFLGKTDAIIIVFFLLAALAFFAYGNTGADAQTAEILCTGEETVTIDLQNIEVPYEMTLRSGIVIGIEKGQIRILSSPCKDKLCVQCGTLTKDGDTAVCLPNRTLVKVTGSKQADAPDIITY